jgi:hypothetical protein
MIRFDYQEPTTLKKVQPDGKEWRRRARNAGGTSLVIMMPSGCSCPKSSSVSDASRNSTR